MKDLKSSPKDVFLHILSIFTLYISAGGLIQLCFQYINLIFPDPLNYYSYSSAAGSIRWSMAALIIVFPVYIFTSWILNKDYQATPEKKELKIRKWLVYFTLFLAAIIIIGDLVSLVYNFLGGDLTARFLLKVAAILAVAGAIFGYYLLDLKRNYTRQQLKILTRSASLIILISIAAGFFTAGSPFKARLYRFDERRINDLQMLQNEIINYWIQKDKLPNTLSDLKNSITGFAPPQDPESGVPYEYQIKTPLAFGLCADFDLESEDLTARVPKAVPSAPYYYESSYSQNWSHGKGLVCFERMIDPELYRDIKNRKNF